MSSLRLFAPALVLAVCALFVGAVGDGRLFAAIACAALACAVVVQVREARRQHHERRERRG